MKRIEWIDIARGIGIILVILGHIGIGGIGKFIYSFHIPLFFFLSGFCFSGNETDFKYFLRKKVKTLIVPYIFLGMVIGLVEVIFKGQSPQVFIDILIQRRAFSIRFITCLFSCDIIFWLLVKINKNNLLKLFIISMTISILGVIYLKLKLPALPWNLDLSFTVMIIFYIGYWFKYKGYNLVMNNSKKYWILFIMLIVNIVTNILNLKFHTNTLDLYHGQLANSLYSLIAAISGITVVVIMSEYLKKFYVVKNVFLNIVKDSLIYFSLHQVIVFSLMDKIFEILKIFSNDTSSDKFLKKLIIFMSVFIILKPFAEIMKRTKLKIFIGL